MILAHAYFPRYGGDLHFDDDEPWSSDKEKGLDLYGVAVHEIGHALGLKHSHVSASIMAPYYQTYTGTQLRLHKDDMLALERLYGENGVAIRRIDQPSICDNAALDAITRLQNGTIYAFQGNFVWVIEDMAASRKLVPIRISSLWPEIEGPLDAVLTLPNGSSYVFKSSKYWMLSQDGAVLPGYPREIRLGLVDMPLSVDAAFVYHGDDRTYFVRKDRYWKYSRYGMPQSWPRQLRTIFKGSAPQRIDAAFRFDGNSTFAFVGNKFWRLTGSDQIRAVDGPRSTAKYWFNCDNQISNKN